MPPKVRSVRLGPVTMPPVLAGLMAMMVLFSLAGVIGARNGEPWLVANSILALPAVWHGQLWRLATFVFFEGHPTSLLFSCLTLYWFGTDLVGRWGAGRFLAVFFGLAVTSALVTCLVGLVWPAAALVPHAGSAPVLDGLVVAWGILYQRREIRLWGLLRLTGKSLIVLTVGATVLYALYEGLVFFVPHVAAEGAALLWLAGVLPWRDRRRRGRMARGARGEAWSFGSWYEREHPHPVSEQKRKQRP